MPYLQRWPWGCLFGCCAVMTVLAFACGGDEGVPCPPPLPAVGAESAALCSAPCPGKSVCSRGACLPVGPQKSCGPYRYGTELSATNVWHVDGSYRGEKGASDGSTERPYVRIGEAIEQVQRGGAILVADGIYDEALVIEKNVELRCRCPERVTLVGPLVVDASATLYQKRVVYIEGCRIVPRALASGGSPTRWPSCDGTLGPVGIEGRAPLAQNGALVMRLQDSVVEGFCRGVAFEAHPQTGSNLCVSASTLARNSIGLDAVAAPTHAACRDLDGGVVVVQSDVRENREQGVLVRREAESVSLLANRVADNGRFASERGAGVAVQIGVVNAAHLEDNLIRENEGAGIVLVNEGGGSQKPETERDASMVFLHNTLVANGGVGLAVAGLAADQALRIEGNRVLRTAEVEGVGGDGIAVSRDDQPAAPSLLLDNRSQGNRRAGIYLRGVKSGRFERNQLGDNGYALLRDDSAELVSANNALCTSRIANESSSAPPFFPLPQPLQ